MSRILLRPALVLLALVSAAAAQTRPAAPARAGLSAEAAKQLEIQAAECSRAFVEGDYERLVFYTYPKLVELMGGREQIISFLRKGVDEMKAEGFETISYVTSAPTQVLRVGRQTYAIVPAVLRMRSPDGVLVSESFMIAVTADGGKNWKFVNGSSADPAKLRILFPAAARRLKMPTLKMPTLEPAP